MVARIAIGLGVALALVTVLVVSSRIGSSFATKAVSIAPRLANPLRAVGYAAPDSTPVSAVATPSSMVASAPVFARPTETSAAARRAETAEPVVVAPFRWASAPNVPTGSVGTIAVAATPAPTSAPREIVPETVPQPTATAPPASVRPAPVARAPSHAPPHDPSQWFVNGAASANVSTGPAAAYFTNGASVLTVPGNSLSSRYYSAGAEVTRMPTMNALAERPPRPLTAQGTATNDPGRPSRISIYSVAGGRAALPDDAPTAALPPQAEPGPAH